MATRMPMLTVRVMTPKMFKSTITAAAINTSPQRVREMALRGLRGPSSLPRVKK